MSDIEMTLHTGCAGSCHTVKVDWFDENNVRLSNVIEINILEKDKPRTLQVLVDGNVVFERCNATPKPKPKPKPKLYRNAIVPSVGEFVDYDKDCEFSNNERFTQSAFGKLKSYITLSTGSKQWLDEVCTSWLFCRISLGPEWRSMESAPKDGKPFVALVDGDELFMRRFPNDALWSILDSRLHFLEAMHDQPTAWRPLEVK